MEGMSSVDRLARICAGYDEAGGAAAKVLIRRVWVGDPHRRAGRPAAAGLRQLRRAAGAFGDDQTISAHDPEEVAGRLHQVMTEAGGRRPQSAGPPARDAVRPRAGTDRPPRVRRGAGLRALWVAA